MTIENDKTIDAIGVERSSGMVILTITDHLDWSNVSYHTECLKQKFEFYVNAVLTGLLLQHYPNAIGRDVCIDLLCKFSPNTKGLANISKLAQDIVRSSIRFRAQVHGEEKFLFDLSNKAS